MLNPSFYLALGLPQGMEIVIIAVLILVLFGGAKIPELMRGLGRGVGELQKGLEEGKQAFQESKDEAVAEPVVAKPIGEPVAKAKEEISVSKEH